MLRAAGRITAALLAVTLVGLATSTTAIAGSAGDPGHGCYTGSCPSPTNPTTVTPGASQGQLEISINVEGRTSVGGPYQRTFVKRVPPACWYERNWSGQQYYEWRTSPNYERTQEQMPPQYRSVDWPEWDTHGTEDDGFFYVARCSGDAPVDYVLAYLDSHPVVYVPAGQPAPDTGGDVDPEVLAQAAYEALQLPEGTVAWNPRLTGLNGATLVGTDTWVWVEDAPMTARVTASVPSGTWATVEANLDHMTVSAPGADDTVCTQAGQPWTPGAGTAPCSIRFDHSSIGGHAGTRGDLPTVTMTVATTWTASWTSSLDATPRDLPAQDTEVSTEIAVAEIQAVVGHG
jgi:hypothetical protein